MNINTVIQEKYDLAVEKATLYVKAFNQGGKKKSELKALKSEATSALSDYNSLIEKREYRTWAAEGEPVKTAVRQLNIKGGKSFNYKTDDDNYMSLSIRDKDIPVNLLQMQVTLGKDVFADPKWFNKAEALMSIVLTNLADRIGTSFDCDIAQASREFKFGYKINPRNHEDCIKALQSVFDSILYIDNEGENRVKTVPAIDEYGNTSSPEWTYIRDAMTARTGQSTLSLCKSGMFTTLILEAMHKALTSGTFGLVALEEPEVKEDVKDESKDPEDEPNDESEDEE